MKTPILGSAYVARSVNAADARMINLFPEIVPEGGKEAAFLNRAPGLRRIATVGSGPIRGMWSFGGYSYVVSGNTVYRLDTLWNAVEIGTVVGSPDPVVMTDNGGVLFIACDGPSYTYFAETNSFDEINHPDFEGAMTVGYLDGYFVFNAPDSQRVYTVNSVTSTGYIYPLVFDPLDFASAEGSPDGVVGIIIDHRECWVFGTTSTEVWYPITDPGTDFPLDRVTGAFNEIGCASPHSIAKMDNSIFWLAQDARGQGMVYRADGYTGKRISTHSVEWQIQQYETISDAIGYTYQQDGHMFYVLVFPTANRTWVYDASTQTWHERAGFSDGEFIRHRSNCQTFFNGENLVGDYENGNVYALDLDVYADDTEVQKILRSWRALPTGQNNLKRTAHHSLQLDMETGVGLVSGQGSNPQVMLRWSDDGGHTWSSEHWASAGRIGEYDVRTIWRRLGMTQKLRDRVYEISMTDPVKVAIMGAELIVSGTNA